MGVKCWLFFCHSDSYLLIPIHFFVKTQKLLNPNKLAGPLESISQICRNVWHSLDSKKSVILSILLLYFAGVALSVFVTNPLTHGPTHFNDEIRYWETALSLYQGNFTAAKFYRSPPFYPISLLPAFYLSYPFGGFTFSKLLNCALYNKRYYSRIFIITEIYKEKYFNSRNYIAVF